MLNEAKEEDAEGNEASAEFQEACSDRSRIQPAENP